MPLLGLALALERARVLRVQGRAPRRSAAWPPRACPPRAAARPRPGRPRCAAAPRPRPGARWLARGCAGPSSDRDRCWVVRVEDLGRAPAPGPAGQRLLELARLVQLVRLLAQAVTSVRASRAGAALGVLPPGAARLPPRRAGAAARGTARRFCLIAPCSSSMLNMRMARVVVAQAQVADALLVVGEVVSTNSRPYVCSLRPESRLEACAACAGCCRACVALALAGMRSSPASR